MHLKRINMHLKRKKIHKYASKPPKNVHIPPCPGMEEGSYLKAPGPGSPGYDENATRMRRECDANATRMRRERDEDPQYEDFL